MNTQVTIMLSGMVTQRRCLAISWSLSRDIVTVLQPSLSAFWPRFYLPISSIRRAALREIGDQAWQRLLDDHDQLAKQVVEKRRGAWLRPRATAFCAPFDGPRRAVRCALGFGTAADANRAAPASQTPHWRGGIEGSHMGGIAVRAARLMARWDSGEVLVHGS